MKVKLDIIRCSQKAETHYKEWLWVDDEFHPEGGYRLLVDKTYKSPKIRVDFYAKTDKDLRVGAIYSDGVNSFKAISANEIVNATDIVDYFAIPTELELVGELYSENQEDPEDILP